MSDQMIAKLDTVEKGIKDYKDATDAGLKATKEEFELLKKATDAWEARYKAQEEKYTDLESKIKTVDEHNVSLEKQLKAKQLTPGEQLRFVDLLGKAVEENWAEISKYKENSGGRRFKMYIKAPADMGITTNVTDAGAYFTTVQIGIRALPNRKVHMREILPLGTMTSSSLTYMREEGGEGALTPVLENADKPQFDRNFQEITVPAEYIAGWLRVSRKMLDDMAAFRSYLQMRLMEMYLLAEDFQTLSGSGVSPQLEGLLTVATAATVTTGPNVERLVYAIAQLESTNFSATGIVLHPAAYYDIALNKATGSGEYDLPIPLVVIQNGQLYIAGVPVYKTTAIAPDTYLVGDFTMGAQLFIREQPIVEFFDQDANNVTTNKITVRIEGRVALAIYRTAAFVKGTFTGIPVFPLPTT